MIGMAETGFIIYYVAVHFVIHKTIAYRINNRFMQRKLDGDHPRSARQKKNDSTEGTFHSDHIRTGEISYSKLALYNV